jgi:methylase of polypeptide subunit release factors
MTRTELQSLLRSRYDRGRWLSLLRELLPSTQPWAGAQSRALIDRAVTSAVQIATIPLAADRTIAVLEVKVSGQVDLQRNRVGLRNLVARFIDQEKAHAVLAIFLGDADDYRFSFVARTSEIGADGQLSTSETAPRRYTYLLGPGQACRTAVERFETLRSIGARAGLVDLVNAFKVEPLFKEFYHDYDAVFRKVEASIAPTLPDKEKLRLFTQRLFNRLMFLAFIARKGWLRFDARTDFLPALWDQYTARLRTARGTSNFYRDHLVPLFFEGLNQPDRPAGAADPRFGVVPYLNGGLFERADDGTDDLTSLWVPDDVAAAILDPENGLFSRYNFTVAESTPLEIDVAVDPEMLGKVFEELVNGRHEQGSYYTPKPIVSFMGRAALVEFLADRCPEEPRPALEKFVHDHDPALLRNAEAVLAALRSVTICDLACGSGAYLLGMLHELLDLRTCLFAAVQKLDARTAHERKLEIIERNLYGVDLDPFAVNIARLRLWLSLAVEFDGHVPPALPNLDFKIERGDALAAPAPQDIFQRDAVKEFRDKKAAFLRAHGADKAKLREEVERIRHDLAYWQQVDKAGHGFNWAVEFAEVFLPNEQDRALLSELLVKEDEKPAPITAGGFDIVVANPPYVRMELIKPQKPILRKRFPLVHAERADLYVYFYARAHELLRPGGVAAFISSNKWLRAGYGESLRQHLLDSQAFRLVMDFGELGVFDSAATDAAIFLWQKLPRADAATRWAMVKDLSGCYAEGVRPHFERLATSVPASQFGEGKPRLASSAAANLRGKMERSGPRLGELCRGVLGWGVKTGLNDAFIIDQATRDRLVAETPAAKDIIKPLLAGDDVRRYEVHSRSTYLIYTYHGVDIHNYPAVEKHLKPFRSFKNEKGETVGLDHRATEQEWYELQQPQMAYRNFFAAPKIVYPDFGKELRFAMDREGHYGLNTSYFIAREDWYLLAVLNSAAVFQYLKGTCQLLGDEDDGGRLRFFGQYLDTLPIPDAPAAARNEVGRMAQEVQSFHGKRRARVERFLRDIGLAPDQVTSRNPLEQPWSLSEAEFAKRVRKLTGRAPDLKLYEAARDETAALTEQIAKLEADIDARVAALYGLDAEDQRWAVQAAPAGQSDDKQAVLFGVLGRLKDDKAYFPVEAIQTAVNDAELAIKDASLKTYLSEAVKQGLVSDAGRGWYSGHTKRVALDPKPVAKLIRTVEKDFPLLDFAVWSTAQINPWMHHLLAQPVAFLNAPAETLESIGDKLRADGWEVAVNPPASTAAKLVRPGEKMVILRPALSRQPAPVARQATIEQILVDLAVESGPLALMDAAEAAAVIKAILDIHLLQIASMLRYADSRKAKIAALEAIDQRHSVTFGDVS